MKTIKYLLIASLMLNVPIPVHGHHYETDSQAVHEAFLNGVKIELQAILLEFSNKEVFIDLMNRALENYKIAEYWSEKLSLYNVYPDVYNTFIKAHGGDKDSQLKVSGLYKDGREDDVPDNRTAELYWLSRSIQDDSTDPYGFYKKPSKTGLFQLTAREMGGLAFALLTGGAAGMIIGQALATAFEQPLLMLAGLAMGAAFGGVSWFGGSKFVTWFGEWSEKRADNALKGRLDEECIKADILTESEYQEKLEKAQANLAANLKRFQHHESSSETAEIIDSFAEEKDEEAELESVIDMEEGRMGEPKIPETIPNHIQNLMKGIDPHKHKQAWAALLERTRLMREFAAQDARQDPLLDDDSILRGSTVCAKSNLRQATRHYRKKDKPNHQEIEEEEGVIFVDE
jgi:hypothetical protein